MAGLDRTGRVARDQSRNGLAVCTLPWPARTAARGSSRRTPANCTRARYLGWLGRLPRRGIKRNPPAAVVAIFRRGGPHWLRVFSRRALTPSSLGRDASWFSRFDSLVVSDGFGPRCRPY